MHTSLLLSTTARFTCTLPMLWRRRMTPTLPCDIPTKPRRRRGFGHGPRGFNRSHRCTLCLDFALDINQRKYPAPYHDGCLLAAALDPHNKHASRRLAACMELEVRVTILVPCLQLVSSAGETSPPGRGMSIEASSCRVAICVFPYPKSKEAKTILILCTNRALSHAAKKNYMHRR